MFLFWIMLATSIRCPDSRSTFLSWSRDFLIADYKIVSQISFWLSSVFRFRFASVRSLCLACCFAVLNASASLLWSDCDYLILAVPSFCACYHIWHIFLERAQNKMNVQSLTKKQFTPRKTFPFLSFFIFFSPLHNLFQLTMKTNPLLKLWSKSFSVSSF